MPSSSSPFSPPQANEPSSNLRRGTAIVASLVVPGTGHVAIGQWIRGLAWFLSLALSAFLTNHVVRYGRFWLFAGVLVLALGLKFICAVDAYRQAAGAKARPSWWILLPIFSVAFVVQTVGSRLSRIHQAESFQMPSGSMEPTLLPGDHFLASKDTHEINRGDVVAFSWPGRPDAKFVRRVVAVGRDVIAIKDGVVHLNDRPMLLLPVVATPAESSAPTGSSEELFEETLDGVKHPVLLATRASRDMEPRAVPQGHVFLLGDHRSTAQDSRAWGSLKLEHLTGHVRFVFWSQVPGGAVRWGRLGQQIH